MKRNNGWLRMSYWLGAIVDGFMVVPMLFPGFGGLVFGIDHFQPGVEYRYAMMIGASLMLGWTSLLIWADRKPVARKGVILITVVPVILGMVLAGFFAVTNGLIRLERMVPTWVLQAIITIVFLYSYFTTPKIEE